LTLFPSRGCAHASRKGIRNFAKFRKSEKYKSDSTQRNAATQTTTESEKAAQQPTRPWTAATSGQPAPNGHQQAKQKRRARTQEDTVFAFASLYS